MDNVIQVLEDMLWGCVLDFLGSWDKYIPLMEFAYNNSYKTSVGMAGNVEILLVGHT